jgi:hypothetical protein
MCGVSEACHVMPGSAARLSTRTSMTANLSSPNWPWTLNASYFRKMLMFQPSAAAQQSRHPLFPVVVTGRSRYRRYRYQPPGGSVRYRYQPLPATARDPAAVTATSRYPVRLAATAAACMYNYPLAAAAAHSSDMPCPASDDDSCQS